MHDAGNGRLPETLPAASLSPAERDLSGRGAVHVRAGAQLCGQAARSDLLARAAAGEHAAAALHVQPGADHVASADSVGHGADEIQPGDEAGVVRHVPQVSHAQVCRLHYAPHAVRLGAGHV